MKTYQLVSKRVNIAHLDLSTWSVQTSTQGATFPMVLGVFTFVWLRQIWGTWNKNEFPWTEKEMNFLLRSRLLLCFHMFLHTFILFWGTAIHSCVFMCFHVYISVNLRYLTFSHSRYAKKTTRISYQRCPLPWMWAPVCIKASSQPALPESSQLLSERVS